MGVFLCIKRGKKGAENIQNGIFLYFLYKFMSALNVVISTDTLVFTCGFFHRLEVMDNAKLAVG